MPDLYTDLSAEDRREVIAIASEKTGRANLLIEKDIWVVLALDALFASPCGEHMVFKGGTSLSKVYRAIDRFSEDIDLTYDIRQLVPDLVEKAGGTLPPTRSQGSKWSATIRSKLSAWVTDSIVPLLKETVAAKGRCTIKAEGETIRIEYEPMFDHDGYVRPSVLLEFGGRSTGEPCDQTTVTCDVAPHIPDVIFPTASVRAMRAERTFWEKATAAHVFCHKGIFSGERFARHWYDLVKLDDIGLADVAIADRALAEAVADHKSMFFIEKTGGRIISYPDAVQGQLRLVPDGDARKVLEKDYAAMAVLFETTPPSFDDLMDRCRSIEERANKKAILAGTAAS